MDFMQANKVYGQRRILFAQAGTSVFAFFCCIKFSRVVGFSLLLNGLFACFLYATEGVVV